MIDDPIVAEVRAIRAKMLKECGGDLGKLIARVHRTTQKLGLKTVSFVKKRPGDSAKATVLTARLAAPANTRKRKAV